MIKNLKKTEINKAISDYEKGISDMEELIYKYPHFTDNQLKKLVTKTDIIFIRFDYLIKDLEKIKYYNEVKKYLKKAKRDPWYQSFGHYPNLIFDERIKNCKELIKYNKGFILALKDEYRITENVKEKKRLPFVYYP